MRGQNDAINVFKKDSMAKVTSSLTRKSVTPSAARMELVRLTNSEYMNAPIARRA